MLEDILPLLAIICIFGLPIGGWITLRVLQHKERMELIRRGMNPGMQPGPKWSAPPPAAARPADNSYGPSTQAQQQLRRGIMTAFIGFALLIGLSFIGYHDGGWEPGPWLLGGLIPMFVGIAQVIGALLSGAEFPRGRATFVPGGARYETPPPPQPPPPSGPYTYRPPGNQEELPRTNPPKPL